ncbi:hypothetical protein MIND_00139300 [Mycena indigotica]|uniref:Uncharacterized protein n=1 Tax=Mycena indigotica TaxID=2126181 RepID=A0A8H6WKX7_9AGAR|nr:uncharacterized protein MIND_00139300 [Mycena indigotica]KAF7316209.1 hypothetical protein MIND_00139300 [Mycena indigotica]
MATQPPVTFSWLPLARCAFVLALSTRALVPSSPLRRRLYPFCFILLYCLYIADIVLYCSRLGAGLCGHDNYIHVILLCIIVHPLSYFIFLFAITTCDKLEDLGKLGEFLLSLRTSRGLMFNAFLNSCEMSRDSPLKRESLRPTRQKKQFN